MTAHNHFDLRAAARKALVENGFLADVPASAMAEIDALAGDSTREGADARDLRTLPWSSIDNDNSRDLDQVEVAEKLPNGDVRVRVGIADVDGLVPIGSEIDKFAEADTDKSKALTPAEYATTAPKPRPKKPNCACA